MLRLVATILFASAAVSQAAETAAGRWEGVAQIPGNELRLIVDLSDEGGKGWIGSIIIPGFDVKGAPLVDLHVRGDDLDFAIKGALGNERSGRTELKGHLSAPIISTDRQFNIGAIFSTPLVMDGVVYFGSTDGNLYAIE